MRRDVAWVRRLPRSAAARGLPRSAAAVIVAAVAMAVALALRVGGADVVQPLDNFATMLAALVGGLVALWRCRRAGALRRAWVALAVGLISWGIGQAIWTW